MEERRTPEREVGLRSERSGFDPHSGRRVVSLSKIHLPPKSTGNTQEAVAPSQLFTGTLSKNETKTK